MADLSSDDDIDDVEIELTLLGDIKGSDARIGYFNALPPDMQRSLIRRLRAARNLSGATLKGHSRALAMLEKTIPSPALVLESEFLSAPRSRPATITPAANADTSPPVPPPPEPAAARPDYLDTISRNLFPTNARPSNALNPPAVLLAAEGPLPTALTRPVVQKISVAALFAALSSRGLPPLSPVWEPRLYQISKRRAIDPILLLQAIFHQLPEPPESPPHLPLACSLIPYPRSDVFHLSEKFGVGLTAVPLADLRHILGSRPYPRPPALPDGVTPTSCPVIIELEVSNTNTPGPARCSIFSIFLQAPGITPWVPNQTLPLDRQGILFPDRMGCGTTLGACFEHARYATSDTARLLSSTSGDNRTYYMFDRLCDLLWQHHQVDNHRGRPPYTLLSVHLAYPVTPLDERKPAARSRSTYPPKRGTVKKEKNKRKHHNY
jgi:hypothetical protein